MNGPADPELECPHCGADVRYLERDGACWLCASCARTFPALSGNDKRFLRGLHIEAVG